MSKITLCEKCGSVMVPVSDENNLGMICPNCGYGYVTSYIEPIYEDQQEYEIVLTDGNTITKENFSLIQSLTGKNMIEIKLLFDNATYSLFKGSAPEVKKLKEKLDNLKMKFEIIPEFKY